jgi:DNA-binding XRE family transcriptional regulator
VVPPVLVQEARSSPGKVTSTLCSSLNTSSSQGKGLRLSTIRAALARYRCVDLYLFAVFAFGPVADVDHAGDAGVGTMILVVRGDRGRREWITGGRYPCLDHEALLRGPCLRGVPALAGAVSLQPQLTTVLHAILQIVLKYLRMLRTVEVDVDKLKELRIDQGLTQSELARRAGLTPGAVWNLEHRGTGSPATVKKIADVLGVRASQLVRGG